MKAISVYSSTEEIAHAVSHGIGAALSIAGMTCLILLAANDGNWLKIWAFSIYGLSLFLLYLASTLYHSFQNPRIKAVLKKIDHSAIFVLIAGTYTPFILVILEDGWRWGAISLIWVLALAGIFLKIFHMHKTQKLSLFLYLSMGWMVVFIGNQLFIKLSTVGISFLVAGGLAYTLGVLFYVRKKMPYHHAIWHLFVLGGSVCHFIAIFHDVLQAHS